MEFWRNKLPSTHWLTSEGTGCQQSTRETLCSRSCQAGEMWDVRLLPCAQVRKYHPIAVRPASGTAHSRRTAVPLTVYRSWLSSFGSEIVLDFFTFWHFREISYCIVKKKNLSVVGLFSLNYFLLSRQLFCILYKVLYLFLRSPFLVV